MTCLSFPFPISELRKFKVWGWLNSWGLESSDNLLIYIFGTWVRRTRRPGLPTGVSSHGLPVWPGFIIAWQSQECQTSYLLAQGSNDDCPCEPDGMSGLWSSVTKPQKSYSSTSNTFYWVQVSHKLLRFKSRAYRTHLSIGRISMNLKIDFKVIIFMNWRISYNYYLWKCGPGAWCCENFASLSSAVTQGRNNLKKCNNHLLLLTKIQQGLNVF